MQQSLSIGLLLIFSQSLHWLPVAGADEPGDIPDQPLHLILPTIALSLGWVGSRVTERRVIWRYALRPALVPLVTILGLGLGDMIRDGYVYLDQSWWPTIASALVLCIMTLGSTPLAEAACDAFDPKQKVMS